MILIGFDSVKRNRLINGKVLRERFYRCPMNRTKVLIWADVFGRWVLMEDGDTGSGQRGERNVKAIKNQLIYDH